MKFIVSPSSTLSGQLTIPGDKSISHRAIMLGALASGTTEVSGFLQGEDTLATLHAFADMGVNIQQTHKKILIEGVGLHGLQKPKTPLDVGNSGTSMRLLSGILVGQTFDTTLCGDHSLSKRPMNRIIAPLTQMGAGIEGQVFKGKSGRPPLTIYGNNTLKAIEYRLPMASAQVKSCVLLAGLYANGPTCVIEPEPTRDHTERMLQSFRYPITVKDTHITVQPNGTLVATHIDVPSDISSAAFFIVGACIAKNSAVVLPRIGINPRRTGVIDILKAMGADITLNNTQMLQGEPVADIHIKGGRLKGIDIPQQYIASAIDEFPALFIAAACAEGKTVLRGAEELRVKESDRIQVMAEGLLKLGVHATPTADGMIIEGQKDRFHAADIDSCGDHRIAMAFSMAALQANGPITLHDCDNVATSFPNFATLAQTAGVKLQVAP